MKCWKCGNDVTTGASKCLSCGADLNRSIPKTDIGIAMRQLYDRYGKDSVLGKIEYLDQGLADLLNASGDIPQNANKTRRLIRNAMEEGLGRAYLEQLNGSGIPDKAFVSRINTLMTEDVGLSEKTSDEILGYFDEMIGWRSDAVEEIIRPVPKPDPDPEPEPVSEQNTDLGPNLNKESKQYNKTKPFLIIGFAVVLLILSIFFIIPAINKPKITPLSSASVGDVVLFGSYEQDNNTSNGKEDIEWLVLAKEDGKALVISRYGLDCKRYNDTFTDVTWETCTLRKWLNETFIYNAFTSDEQDLIQNSTVTADKNPYYDTSPGNTVNNKIFLLSITEAEKYFSTNGSRKCVPTDYAIAQGAYHSDRYTIAGGCCWWWLRSPGNYSSLAAAVLDNGSVIEYGFNVDNHGSVYSNGNFVSSDCAVRPALWINLES